MTTPYLWCVSSFLHRYHRYVFIFDPESLALPNVATKLLCVSECPDKMLMSRDDLASLALNRSIFLCDYNLGPDEYQGAEDGACPSIPVDARRVAGLRPSLCVLQNSLQPATRKSEAPRSSLDRLRPETLHWQRIYENMCLGGSTACDCGE